MNDLWSASSFRLSHCDAMALVLHEWTGLPLGLWRAFYHDEADDDDDDEAFVDVHAVVRLVSASPDHWLDVDGIHHGGKPGNLLLPSGTVRVELVDASPFEVAQAFTMSADLVDWIERDKGNDAVPECETIVAAKDFIRGTPSLRRMVESLKSSEAVVDHRPARHPTNRPR